MDDRKQEIYESLLHQLALMGADVAVFEDLVDKYMEMWEVDSLLTNDIMKRGVMYEDVSSVGIPMMKNNPSVKEKVAINRQMLQILSQLNIKTEGIGNSCADEEL